MSRSDELDLLNSDTHEQLDDTTITIHQNRPLSVADPSTRLRNIDAGAVNLSVAAVEGIDSKTNQGGRWVRVRSWFVTASLLTFVPSRNGKITDSDGLQWKIYNIERRNNAREYEIFGELVS